MQRLLKLPLPQIEFAIVDLETTGFSAAHDSILEIAAVKVKSGLIGETFQSLIYTEFVPYYSTRVHGIDAEMLKDAPLLHTVKNKFSAFVKGCVFVGHNIKAFDLPFLRNSFDMSEEIYCVDTLKLSRRLFKYERTHRLSAVATRLGVYSARYHRALDDALVTARIFLAFLEREKGNLKILKDIVA